MNPEEYIKWINLFLNGTVLIIIGLLYKAYVQSLKESINSKDEQVKTITMNMNFWKDKAVDLEKKTPEFMENVLGNRIKIREDEIGRLRLDKETHIEELKIKEQELLRLKSELEKTKDVSRQFLFFDEYFNKDDKSKDELEIEEIGIVGVDSGQLMITDPCYIDSEWEKEEFEDIRLYKDINTSMVFQYMKDFKQYDEVLELYNKTANNLIEEKIWEPIEVVSELTYSYKGACAATLSKNGYGELNYKMGHKGAGIAFKTLLGDGEYPVYAEKYNGEVVRVYVNLA